MAEERGAALMQWTFAEYERHVRGRGWYATAATVALALLAYAFATRNFLFSVIIVMLAVVIYLHQTREPQQLTCQLTEHGIACDGRFRSYDQLREFWVAEREGTTPQLYLRTRGVPPWLAIPITDGSADQVRAILGGHLPESEERDEPPAETFGRLLKL